MAILLILAVVAGLGGWLTVRRHEPGDPAPLVLLMLPLALMFVVAPLPVVSLRTIGLFQSIAETGQSGGPLFASGAARSLTWPLVGGAAGALTMLAVAMLLGRTAPPADDVNASPAVRLPSKRIGWPLGIAVLLIVPAGILLWFVSGVAPLIVEAASLLTPDGTPRDEVSHRIGEYSSMISVRLLAGVLGGVVLSGLLLLLAGFNIVAARGASLSPHLLAVSKATIAVGALGLLLFVALSLAAIQTNWGQDLN